MKITSEEKEYIFSIIKEHLDYPLKDKPIYTIFEENNLYEKGFTLEGGAVKECILYEGFGDYVVKFCRKYNSDENFFDYCEREYTNYLAAVEKGLEKFFPYTDYLGYFNGINFYIQECALCDNEAVSSIWYEELREHYESEEEDEDEDTINDKIWDMMYDLEDEERASMCFGYEPELLEFLYDYRINDLHEGNFGYIDGRLVIIDFSGYGCKVRERSF